MVRFDFQFDGATDLRLVTGASGSYNTVIHIRRDHFYLQTASDPRGPWFSMRHGECAYDFVPGQWYTMTVEFLGDEAVAHLDAKHLVYAKHPIIDQERTYFALQVDRAGAAFDNLQVFTAGRHRDHEANRARIAKLTGKFPVKKTTPDAYEIRKRNVHARLHLDDAKYRDLVAVVEVLDADKKKRFPAVFSSNKTFRKKIAEQRKKLHAEDPVYKETLFATHRANRAMEAYLKEQNPAIEAGSETSRKATLERTRLKHRNDPAYQKLAATAAAAQRKLETDYPQLFVSDAAIKAKRDAARQAIKAQPEYKALTAKRAEAYRAQQDYLHQSDSQITALQQQLQKIKDQEKK